MQDLPKEISEQFMKGQHSGFFNGIWKDMAIEINCMQYGKESGITFKPGSMKTWVYSLHICLNVIHELSKMREHERPHTQTHHKEETPARIESDGQDR